MQLAWMNMSTESENAGQIFLRVVFNFTTDDDVPQQLQIISFEFLPGLLKWFHFLFTWGIVQIC